MNFDFSVEQKQFGDQLRRLLSASAPFSECRRALEGQVLYSEAAWRGLSDLGVTAITIPEAFGGLGLGPLEQCVAAEEIGRALAAVPGLSSVYVCTEAVRLYGSPQQQARWLPALARGDLIGTWAAAESPNELRDGALQVRFRGGRLYGAKRPVLDGMAAGLAVVLAADDAGDVGLYACEIPAGGLERRQIANVDPSRPVAEIEFAGAPAEPLGGAGWEAWRHLQRRAAILLAFEQVGGADRALEMARDYALQRHSFGRPIGSYQAIKHKLATAYAKNQLARSHAYYGAWALNAGAAELGMAAAGARVAATDAFSFAAQENLQTHGGVGYTWAGDCQLFYRRARQHALILGSVRSWRRALLAELRLAA